MKTWCVDQVCEQTVTLDNLNYSLTAPNAMPLTM